MSVITFDANGMFEESKKNHKSEIGVNYTKEDVTTTWKTIATYVSEIMKTYNGVEIPNLGTFTFQTQNGQDNRLKPCFKVSRFLSHMYQVRSSDIKLKNATHIYKINEVSIADKMSKHYIMVTVCVKEVIHALQRLLSQGKDVDFPFPGVCVLQFRKGAVKAVFQRVFSHECIEEKGDAPVMCTRKESNEYVPVMGEVLKLNHVCNQNSKQYNCCTGKAKQATFNSELVLETITPRPSMNIPLGPKPSIMNLTYFDSENPPVVGPPKHDTFFQKIPITQLETQCQYEIAIGECRENVGKTVCDMCAQSLERGYVCDFARKLHKKVPEAEPYNVETFSDYLSAAYEKGNRETAEYNKQIALQKMKAGNCEDTSGFSYNLFANRPPTTQNMEREINYRKDLKNTILQHEKELAVEREKEILKEREEVRRNKRILEEDEMRNRCYLAQRQKDVAEENKYIIQQNAVKLQEQKIADPLLYLHYKAGTQDEDNTNKSKVTQLRNTMCNLQLQAYKCQKQLETKCQELTDSKNATKRVQDSLAQEKVICNLRKDFLRESMNDWKKQIKEKECKKREEKERKKEPVLDLLDQLEHVKRCTICKKNLKCCKE